jgi:hypothetical protein
MVVSALTPHASTQIDCSIWLEKFVKDSGDVIPNANVTSKTFVEAWNTLYPKLCNSSLRQYSWKVFCCAEIDKLHNVGRSRAVLSP